jgi:hypothetical protein
VSKLECRKSPQYPEVEAVLDLVRLRRRPSALRFRMAIFQQAQVDARNDGGVWACCYQECWSCVSLTRNTETSGGKWYKSTMVLLTHFFEQHGGPLELMAKIEKGRDRRKEAGLLGIEIQGDRVQLSIPEYECSSDEWYGRRNAAFRQLRTYEFIPHQIIDCVESFDERTPVELYAVKEGNPAGLRFRAKIAKHQKLSKPLDDEMSAAEWLAFFLRLYLRELEDAETSRNAAPVRKLNLVPRSLIAELAHDLLGSCQARAYAPGPFLVSLLRELLNLTAYGLGLKLSRQADAKKSAADILAQHPTISTRELARALHVNPSTVSRWRKSPEFRRMVERSGLFFSRMQSPRLR